MEGPRRPEQQPTVVRKAIRDAQAERELRSDDGEVDLFAGREGRNGIEISGVDGNCPDEPRNARISRCGDQVGGVDFVCKTRDEGVLARAATENQNSHCVNDLRGWIGGRGRTTRTGVFR